MEKEVVDVAKDNINMEEEKRDADGGVAAALGRARCGTYGHYTTGCGWEGWRCRNGQIP